MGDLRKYLDAPARTEKRKRIKSLKVSNNKIPTLKFILIRWGNYNTLERIQVWPSVSGVTRGGGGQVGRRPEMDGSGRCLSGRRIWWNSIQSPRPNSYDLLEFKYPWYYTLRELLSDASIKCKTKSWIGSRHRLCHLILNRRFNTVFGVAYLVQCGPFK